MARSNVISSYALAVKSCDNPLRSNRDGILPHFHPLADGSRYATTKFSSRDDLRPGVTYLLSCILWEPNFETLMQRKGLPSHGLCLLTVFERTLNQVQEILQMDPKAAKHLPDLDFLRSELLTRRRHGAEHEQLETPSTAKDQWLLRFMAKYPDVADCLEKFRAMWSAGSGRSLFRTEHGHVGIGHRSLKVGDKLWLLAGGKTPYILSSFHPGAYMGLVGEAYVNGLMFGEFWSSDEGTLTNIKLI